MRVAKGTRLVKLTKLNSLLRLPRSCMRGTCLRLGAKVSGSQNDLLTPWHDGRADIIPVRYLPVLLGGKSISHVGWDTGDLPS